MFTLGKLGNKLATHTVNLGQMQRLHQNTTGNLGLGQLNIAEAAVSRTAGQPTSTTHPHLVAKGHVIPNISAEELWGRRERLSQLVIDSMKKKHADVNAHMIVIPSATKAYMSEKIPYLFRQNSDFLYMSGCQEPDTCLVINIHPEKGHHLSTLFLRERDVHLEAWDGPRTDAADATHLFGVDQALSFKEFPKFLEKQGKDRALSIWYDSSQSQDTIANVMREYLVKNQIKVLDSPKNLIHKIRLIKSKAEIELIHKSCQIASEGIVQCMRQTEPEISEHQLLATIDYECRRRGAQFLAYPPVIAGGTRSTIIHYVHNNQLLKNNELVLMDAGCEYHGYSSDITRTWPVNGRFSSEQRALYEVVLNAQAEVIKLLSKHVCLDKLFEEMCLLLGRGLQEIGLMQKTSSIQNTIREAYQFCPHHVSHYLGMDVHDTSLINRSLNVQPGMVITVEPGVYINEMMKVPKQFHGLGIRIEDDVLITDGDPVILSAKCPKTVADVEKVISTMK